MAKNQHVSLPVLADIEEKKKELRTLIHRKKQELTRAITKNEMLRVELEMVKQEYNVRVGSLYVKDSELEFEIIYYRNLLDLLRQGISRADAEKKLRDMYYSRQKKIQEEKEEIRYDEQIFEQRTGANTVSGSELKKIWKRLISMFHPDLIQDQQEKKKREEIIKQINRAYEEHDLEVLKKIEYEADVTESSESTIEKLETVLVDIENQIITQDQIYQELRTSEWYSWRAKMKMAKTKQKDIFADIERALLNDLVKKYDLINALKAKIPNE